MNMYDHNKFVGVIDIYMSQRVQFFKQLCENQYIHFLNDRVSREGAKSQTQDPNTIYRLHFTKPQRESTANELSKLLDVNVI